VQRSKDLAAELFNEDAQAVLVLSSERRVAHHVCRQEVGQHAWPVVTLVAEWNISPL
jgi:hypothetical protein